MRIETVQDLDQLAGIAGEWDRLADRFVSPLVRSDWLLSCAEAFCRDGQLVVVIVRDAQGLRAAAPLFMRRSPYGSEYQMLGVERLWEPCGFVYDSEEALLSLCAALCRLGRPLVLTRVARDVKVGAALRAASAKAGALITRRAAPSPFLSVDRSWTDFLGSCSSRRRYDLRRARRILEGSGEVAVRVLEPTADDVEDPLREAIAIEARSWKGQNDSAVAQNREMTEFLQRYSLRVAGAGGLRISFLDIGGEPIATQIGICWANRYWILKIGYDEAWAHGSPGLQLMHEMVRHAFESRWAGVEFLGQPEPWLRTWTRSAHPCRTYIYYPWSLAGAWGYAAGVAARIVRRLGGHGRRHATPGEG